MHSKRIGRMAVLCLFLAWSQSAWADGARDDVATALDAMHLWVGTGENGDRWRDYLLSDQLERELKKAQQADVAAVTIVLKRYKSGSAGLDLARFAAVRNALGAWHIELSVSSPAELAETVRQEKGNFQPLSEADVAGAKARLVAAVGQLGQYLAKGGATGEAWKQYLQWDMLQEQLTSADKPNLGVLTTIHDRLTKNHDGLELDVFSNVARELIAFRNVTAVAASPKAGEIYGKRMDALATALDEYAQEASEANNRAIAGHIGWLESASQVPQIVRAVRKHHSHRNLYAHVSANFLNAGMGRSVDRTQDVSDCILGTDICGTGHTTGSVRMHLVPSNRHAAIETVLEGETATDTIGRNGPVSIYTDGITRFRASKVLLVDETGFKSYPTTSTANTSSTVDGIATSRDGRIGERMIRKIAWKRIGQQKSQANEVAGDHAEDRVNESFDTDVNKSLYKSNDSYVEKFRKPLLRLGEFPQQLNLRTSSEYLFVELQQANRFQLGAPGAPPALGGPHDVAIRLHESMVNNFAGALIAGRTFTEESVQQTAIDLLGELPEKLKSEDDEDPWSITFAGSRPVTLLFGDGGFEVTIRGHEYTSGERSFNAMNVKASYKIERTDTGAKLIRQGELEILPPNFVEGQSTLSASQVALRRLLTKKFGTLFPPEIIQDAKVLPGDWAKVGKLRLDELAAEAGWLTLGWAAPEIGKVAVLPGENSSK